MKHHWTGVFVAVGLAATTVLGAQGEVKGNTVTISGCIQDTPMATAGSVLPAPAGADKPYYLNNPAMAADAGRNQGAVGTSGLSLTGYVLEGESKLISPHLNHQVRITGNLQSSSASPTGAAKSAPGSTASMPTLKVESVTMVAAKCEPAK